MKLQTSRIFVAAIALGFTGLSQAAEKPASEYERFSYALGMMVAERVLKQFPEIDYEQLMHGLQDLHQQGELEMTLSESADVLTAYVEREQAKAAEAAISRGQAYLAENAKMDGVTVTDSGLQYSVITAAEGAKPVATDQVKVHYRGTLIDGTEFDSSYSRNSPATFGLNQVIPGWTEAVQLMSVGSKYRFVIPSELAYGERGAGQSIGPNETLIFEVELLEINPES